MINLIQFFLYQGDVDGKKNPVSTMYAVLFYAEKLIKNDMIELMN